MPAGPGEALLTTLFADVHYYFSDPSSRPPHHRFDKGSYVYLFHNATRSQAKIEIANNAGSPHQDAFFGYLNVAYVRYSYLQPTLCTLFINTGAVPDQSTWHLPTLDPKNEQKSMYKLHALDVYLWTEKDATAFLGHLKAVLNAAQLEIKNAPNVGGAGSPHVEHRDSMSPVVQQLERTAIGSQLPPRGDSAVSAQSMPGPPSSQGFEASPSATPMAYNPAAPPAPEPVQYRERTPPPDDGTGTGLAAAAKYDSVPHTQHPGPGIMYQSSAQTTPQLAHQFSGPPQQPSELSQTSFAGPPQLASQGSVPPPPQSPPPHQQRAPSFGPMAQSTLPQSPPPHQQSSQRQSSYGGPGPTQYANYNPQGHYGNQPGTPGFNSQLPPTPSAPPSYSGPGGLQSPGLPPPPSTTVQPQQQVPVGGYNNYSYSAAQVHQSGDLNNRGAYVGDLHNQVYRPTQQEAQPYVKPQRQSQALAGEGKPALAGRVEGNVNKYLKKLDKLW
ncbi:hypothetical protein TI39_contig4338g00005 [Zymoseptoria brevis]|uniref:RNA recognition motif-containing protein n=1 Tax=Zymoseptoria brevis TaxID=1047168 RepID=A0A0F4G7F7_9PEZI|nr:hypothetical protein TI39_contig4338g00005 [Zymoseptoria brevis]